MKPSFGFWPTLLATFAITAGVQLILAVWAFWAGGQESSPTLIGNIVMAIFMPAIALFELLRPITYDPRLAMVIALWLLNAALYTIVIVGIIRAVRYFRNTPTS